MNKTGIRFALLTLVLAMPMAANAQKPPTGGPMMGGQPPMAGAAKMTCEDALKQAPKGDKDLEKLAKAMTDAQAKYKKKPKDAKLKAAYVEATYQYGHTAMLDEKLTPPIRYRAALALYRRALAADPKHKKSLDEKKTIEDIYVTMKRPIPK